MQDGKRRRTAEFARRHLRGRRAEALMVFLLLMSVTLAALSNLPRGVSATDYTFSSETVDYGSTSGSANRNAEDESYETLSETDSQSDTDYNSPSKSITYGTESGTFPGNLQTSDDSYWQLLETNSNPSDYSVTLVPTSDVSIGFDTTYPASPTTHYDKVDDGESHDSDSTYNTAVTNGDKDEYGLQDMSAPSGSPDLDVTVYFYSKDLAAGTNRIDAGLRISSTDYVGVDEYNPGAAYAVQSYAWETNPNTAVEWTYTGINGMNIYLSSGDAAPDILVTSIYIVVTVDYAVNYRCDAELTWSGTSEGTHTTGWTAVIEAKTSAESYDLQFWDYSGSSWNTRKTVTATSDTSYNYDLTANERSGAGEVKAKIVDQSTSGDSTTADTVYFDVFLIRRVDVYYRCSVRMDTSATVPSQELEFRIKGLTDDGESWTVELWNYTSSGWDVEFTITGLSNTWYTTEIAESHQLSGSIVKCRFDNQGSPDKTTASNFYLDYVCVRTINAEPALSQMGSDSPTNVGETADFWAVYTDSDNDAPEYMRVVIDSTPLAMSKNTTDDDYTDGCAYYYSTSALVGGDHPYYFACKDASHDETTGGSGTYTVNRIPTLLSLGVDPATGNNGDTFSFSVRYTDLDDDAPTYIKAHIDDTDYDMAEVDPEDDVFSDSKDYYYDKAMSGGDHTFYFKAADYLSGNVQTTSEDLDVNNKPTLSGFLREPEDPVYPPNQLTFTVTYMDIDGESPTAIKWRETEGAVQNVSMTEVNPEDTNVVDGKQYRTQLYLSHGNHDFDFYATDGNAGSHVMAGDDSVSIGNRAPAITTTPDDDSEWRNAAWGLDLEAEDLDLDDITWELSTNATGMIVDEDTGLLEWTTPETPSWYSITVWANDSYSGSDSHEFELYVVNRLPVISSSGNTTQALGTFLSYCIVASDADLDTLTYEFSTDCPDLSIENNWVNGTVLTEGTYSVSVWVNDTYDSDLEEWELSVDNEAPYFTSTPIYSAANASYYEYDANASDPNPGSTITYSLLTDCPDLEINAETGVVNGTLTLVGSYFVNVTASDGTLTTSQNYTLTATNTLPIFITSPGLEGELGVPYYYDANAEDDNGDVLVFSLYEAPAWLFVDEDTGEVEGTPTAYGEFTVRLRAFDGYGYAWQNWTLTVPSPEVPAEDPVIESSSTFMFWGLVGSVIALAMIATMVRMMNSKKEAKP